MRDTRRGRRTSLATRARGTSRSCSRWCLNARICSRSAAARGRPTPTLAARGRLIGIDISKAQIEHARAAIPDAEFIHGDVTRIDFDPESFDAVVALYVLTHVPGAELPVLLRRIGQWLRQSGVLLATFGGRERHDSFVDDFLGVPMFFSGFDPETNEQLVQEAELTILESRVELMQEPENEPGRGPETGAFHWILGQKGVEAAS